MADYFDSAFRLHLRHPTVSVLLYAVAILFRLRRPRAEVGRVAESGLTQAVLVEPGAAQKVFALLTYWVINGYKLDIELLRRTVERLVVNHESTGPSSDVAWALSFCLQHRIKLTERTAIALRTFRDDCVVLQCLHLRRENLLSARGYPKRLVEGFLNFDLDGPNWLVSYESARHGFLRHAGRAVKGNPLFADLLAKKVTFYRMQLPRYAAIIHPGGAPEWALRSWVRSLLSGEVGEAHGQAPKGGMPQTSEFFRRLSEDIRHLGGEGATHDDVVDDLLDLLSPKDFQDLIQDEKGY